MLYNKPTTSLNEVLLTLINKMGWQDEYDLSIIIKNWTFLVGEKFASESSIESLKDGVLVVNAELSVWRAEIFYRKEKIIEKINVLLDKDTVKEMVVR